MGTDILCHATSDYWWRIYFLYTHAQIPEDEFLKFKSVCESIFRLRNNQDMLNMCIELARQLETQVGSYYKFDLYSSCWYDDKFSSTKRTEVFKASHESCADKQFCEMANDVEIYLSMPQVKRSLNIPLDSQFWSKRNADDFNYEFTEKDNRNFIHQVAVNYPTIKTVVYNGDTDVSVNIFAVFNWTSSLGLKQVRPYQPWKYGHFLEYEGELFVVSIRGSGHFVSLHTGEAGLHLLKAFLLEEEVADVLKSYAREAKSSPTENTVSWQQDSFLYPFMSLLGLMLLGRMCWRSRSLFHNKT